MFRSAKRSIISLVAVGTLAAAFLPATAAPAAAAAGPCIVRSTTLYIADVGELFVIAGEYQAASGGALDVQLTCGAVKDGVTYAKVTEDNPGPVAALAATRALSSGSYYGCYEVTVTYVERQTFTDTCP
jgi:hypothetical protein